MIIISFNVIMYRVSLFQRGIQMTNRRVMVCVTQQKTCERLILNGYNLIETQDEKLYVVHVVNEKARFLDSNNDGEALEYLFDVSKRAGANLTVLRSKDVIQTIIDFAKENDITHMVMGLAPNTDSKPDRGFGFHLRKSCQV